MITTPPTYTNSAYELVALVAANLDKLIVINSYSDELRIVAQDIDNIVTVAGKLTELKELLAHLDMLIATPDVVPMLPDINAVVASEQVIKDVANSIDTPTELPTVAANLPELLSIDDTVTTSGEALGVTAAGLVEADELLVSTTKLADTALVNADEADKLLQEIIDAEAMAALMAKEATNE